MPYDVSLDEQVFAQSWESDRTKLNIGVYSYNGGQRKLQISRELKNQPTKSGFAKLGRLSKEELEGILPLLQEAMAQM